MRKFLSILIGLIMCVLVSINAQHEPYSLSIDSIEQGKIVNLQVSNNPNITLQDNTKLENLILYRVDQAKIVDNVNELTKKIETLQLQSPREKLIKDRGWTDEQVNKSITLNLWLSIITCIIMYIAFLIFDNKPPNTTAWDQIAYYLLIFTIYGFIGSVSYYLISAIFNPNYLMLKEWLNLFG
jgi:hypothetical protein